MENISNNFNENFPLLKFFLYKFTLSNKLSRTLEKILKDVEKTKLRRCGLVNLSLLMDYVLAKSIPFSLLFILMIFSLLAVTSHMFLLQILASIVI